MLVRVFIVLLGCLVSTSVFASLDSKDMINSAAYIQSIHVANFLANTLDDPGMTPTPVTVRFYNGKTNPCWIVTLDYQQDTIVHAGPRTACVDKISHVDVMPLLVAGKLKTYLGSVSTTIDRSKFLTHLNILQLDAPRFDIDSGLVVHSGSVAIQSQSDDV